MTRYGTERNVPSVYKGQYGFSGQKHRKAVLSSLPGASPAASSAWLPRRFCSRKTPQDLPAGKNQGWQGRRTKVGLISHQGRERSQRSFWLLLAYCPLYTEGTIAGYLFSESNLSGRFQLGRSLFFLGKKAEILEISDHLLGKPLVSHRFAEAVGIRFSLLSQLFEQGGAFFPAAA